MYSHGYHVTIFHRTREILLITYTYFLYKYVCTHIIHVDSYMLYVSATYKLQVQHLLLMS